MATDTAREKITKARAGLVLDSPFFGSLALRQTLKDDPSCKTLWTNGRTIGYNPSFVHGLTLAEVKGALAHEVLHIAAAHHARRQNRKPEKWNVAADYAINDILTGAGFVLPKGALTGYGTNQEAESIYNYLPDPPQDQGAGDPDPGGCGEVRDATAPDGQEAGPGDLKQAEAEARVAVSQAAQAAKKCGKLPAGLERLIDTILNPQVPWREVLRRFIDQASRNDYTWTRPSTRYLASGLYLPSLYNQEIRPLAVAVDTSGSIDQETINQFAAELSAIIEETKTTATVIYCDSKVKNVETFDPASLPLTLHPIGGGGTDFRPPFAEVDKLGLEPSCLVYLTDGECYSFPDAPEYPVLWATIGNRFFTPPFGEVTAVA